MAKYLSAKEKAEELGITTSGLAKTRHLYKHIRKSPHKYLYFEEDPREVVRPNMVNGPVTPVNSSTPGPTEDVEYPLEKRIIIRPLEAQGINLKF